MTENQERDCPSTQASSEAPQTSGAMMAGETWWDLPLPNGRVAAYHAARLLNQLRWHLVPSFFFVSPQDKQMVGLVTGRLQAVSHLLVRKATDAIAGRIDEVMGRWWKSLSSDDRPTALVEFLDADKLCSLYGSEEEYCENLIKSWVRPTIRKLRDVFKERLDQQGAWAFALGEHVDGGLRPPDVSKLSKFMCRKPWRLAGEPYEVVEPDEDPGPDEEGGRSVAVSEDQGTTESRAPERAEGENTEESKEDGVDAHVPEAQEGDDKRVPESADGDSTEESKDTENQYSCQSYPDRTGPWRVMLDCPEPGDLPPEDSWLPGLPYLCEKAGISDAITPESLNLRPQPTREEVLAVVEQVDRRIREKLEESVPPAEDQQEDETRKRQGAWAHDRPPPDLESWHGMLQGTISDLTRWVNIRTRKTLVKMNRGGSVWIMKIHGGRYKIWFRDRSEYDRASVLSMASSSKKRTTRDTTARNGT